MPRAKRKAQNQAIFREVNRRIAELSARFGEDAPAQGFICECSRTGCTEIINVPPETYARVRDDPTLFFLVAGHEDPGHEVIIEHLDGYLIVQNKPGTARQVALETA